MESDSGEKSNDFQIRESSLAPLIPNREAFFDELKIEGASERAKLAHFLDAIEKRQAEQERLAEIRSRASQLAAQELSRINKLIAEEAATKLRVLGELREVIGQISPDSAAEEAREEQSVDALAAKVRELVNEREFTFQVLRESQERLELALSSAQDGIWDWDVTTDSLFQTPAWFNVLGYEPFSVDGTMTAMRDLVFKDDSVEVEHFFGEMLRGNRGAVELEIRMLGGDEHYRWCQLNARVAAFDDFGRASRIVGTLRNISLRKELEEATFRAKEQAVAASRAKSEFLANMSHEIRTPMNGVLGLTELVLDSELTSAQRESLLLVQESGKRLLGIINQILDFSKIEAGKVELELLDFDLRNAIHSAVGPLEIMAKKKGLRFLVDVRADVPRVIHSDSLRLSQIFLNLVGNAIKFTQKGEISVTASADKSLDPEGRTLVEFRVTDTGIGIAPDQLPRIFDPFGQADGSTTRNYGGTGLGLTISRQLADLLGGELDAKSELGKGTTFVLRLPLKTVSPPPRIEERLVESEMPASLRGLRAREILLVEDNLINQRIALKMLEKLGYQASLAENGVKALELCKEKNFDLILMDMQMPVMDGLEATRQLRLERQFQKLPIVALTANAMESDQELCREAGMNAFLSKPISFDRLKDTILETLRMFRR